MRVTYPEQGLAAFLTWRVVEISAETGNPYCALCSGKEGQLRISEGVRCSLRGRLSGGGSQGCASLHGPAPQQQRLVVFLSICGVLLLDNVRVFFTYL